MTRITRLRDDVLDRLRHRHAYAQCARCASQVRSGLPACPLCDEPMPIAVEGVLAQWRRSGAVELTGAAVVTLLFVATWLFILVVFLRHR
jgi:hypothetical protein